ncbi:hypothetical protein EB118_00790 [bacterium]|nr:hypothetical protein [bacterium]NBX98405.1 hypothetical protein [bacterium]NDC93691.1 hypothetical protein [bacterium]NDD84649.1 hypothetical protein [bacterium]NDG28627.1 hypothetical protein [bacterium]
MALHTFEANITLAGRQYDNVVGYFGRNLDAVPREYQSLSPLFQLGDVGRRIGEIAFTHAEDSEFAGVLYVSDSDKVQRNYDRLLEVVGLPSIEDVPTGNFRTHLIAGKRIGSSENDFTTTSIIRTCCQQRSQVKAENKFIELVRSYNIDEFQIKPQDVYDLAKLLKPKAKKTTPTIKQA